MLSRQFHPGGTTLRRLAGLWRTDAISLASPWEIPVELAVGICRGPDKAETGDRWQGRKLEWCWALGTGRAGEEGGRRGPRKASQAGEGRWGPPASEAALDERVAEKTVRGGPPLLLHEHLPQEVPARVGHTVGEHGLRRLGGNFKNGCHGLVLGPRRFLGQHFHDGAGDTPEDHQEPGD